MNNRIMAALLCLSVVASCNYLKCLDCYGYRTPEGGYLGVKGDPECIDGGDITKLRSVDCRAMPNKRAVCSTENGLATVLHNGETVRVKGIEKGCFYLDSGTTNDCFPVTDSSFYENCGQVISHTGQRCFCSEDNCRP